MRPFDTFLLLFKCVRVQISLFLSRSVDEEDTESICFGSPAVTAGRAPKVHSRGSNFSKLERGELWTGAFLFSLRGGTKKIELRLLTNRLYSFSSFTRTHTHTQRQQNRIPKYRFVKLCLIYYLISPRFKGAVTLYKSCIAPIFRKLSPSIDKTGVLLMKGDFQAVRKELGPQLKELQSFVQKDGPEAVNRLLSKVKNTKPAAGGSSDDAAKEN